MNFNFYIIYSIDIPIDLNKQWNEYENMTTRELMYTFKKESINLPFDEYEENGDEDDAIDYIGSELIPFTEYKETDEFYDDYYGEFREEMIEILVNQEKSEEEINKILKESLPYYITNNPDKFYCTESDNNSDEYSYVYLNTIHRKYTAELNNEEFIEFAENFNGCSTCNTMGSLTFEYGFLPAFSIDSDTQNIESIYVSILFKEELEEDEMQEIETKVRELIEQGDLTLNYLNNL